MKQMDDNIGYVLKKLEDMGELDNTLVVFTTDNGAETITFPDGGVTPFRGGKLTTWEGGMRAPLVVRWPGHIEPDKGGSARDHLFYYSGANPSAVRYKNWKLYYAMAQSTASGGLMGVQTYHWTQITNIKRDPFERNVLADQSLLAAGGALAAPSTAYLYDWNLLPIGQAMWMQELETYRTFPSLQAPASYNLDQVIKAMQDAKHISHAGE